MIKVRVLVIVLLAAIHLSQKAEATENFLNLKEMNLIAIPNPSTHPRFGIMTLPTDSSAASSPDIEQEFLTARATDICRTQECGGVQCLYAKDYKVENRKIQRHRKNEAVQYLVKYPDGRVNWKPIFKGPVLDLEHTFFDSITCSSDSSDSTVDPSDRIRLEVRQRQASATGKEIRSKLMKSSAIAIGCAGVCYLSPAVGAIVGSASIYGLKDDLTTVSGYYMGTGTQSDSLSQANRLNSLEEEFELKKSSIPEFNKKLAQDLLKELRNAIGYGFRAIPAWETQHLMDRVSSIISFPTGFTSSPDFREALRELDQHLQTYSDETHDEVMKAAGKIYASTFIQDSRDEAKVSQKSAFLFLGEAGVGKTETASAIAKSLKRPFCKINLGSIQVDELMGKPSQGYGSQGVVGKITRCFLRPDEGEKSLDPIIFIDEVHDVLNEKSDNAKKFYSLLKILTEANEKEIEDNGLKLKVNLSRTTFILASNAPFAEDTAGALKSRLTTIQFMRLTREQKRIIAIRHFENLIRAYSYNATEDDQRILDEIVAMDESPGARILMKVIEDYIFHKKSEEFGSLRTKGFNIKESFLRNGI